MKRINEIKARKDTVLKNGPITCWKDALLRVAEYYPNDNILAELDENKNIVYHTSKDVLNDVTYLGEALLDLGLEGKHICITSENSYLYVIADAAIVCGVGISTPIDAGAPLELLTLLLNKCECDAIFTTSSLLAKVKNAKANVSTLKTIITLDKKCGDALYVKDLMEKGKELSVSRRYLSKEINLDDTAELLFTSGTTGANKAVMLSHKNMGVNIMNCLEMIQGPIDGSKNTSMSVLPMHHATEINTHIFPRIAAGRLTYINDSMKNMMTNIKIFKPYVITIVPMIANAFYKNIWIEVKKAGMEKKLKMGIKVCNLVKRLTGKDITHKLFPDVFKAFGGNLNEIICGGAMLSPEVVEGLSDLGIYTMNGYGITECGPLCSLNANMKYPYSVGKTPSRLKASLINKDENGIGELCFKGESISKGYYKDEIATKKSFDEDGTFHTGDLARIDKAGRIFMTGRKINAIVLENGKNICPEEVEAIISEHIPYLNDVVVYSVKKKGIAGEHEMLVCGIFIQDETMKNNREKIANDFKEVNKVLPVYEHIAYVNMPEEEYQKTALLKVKRNTIMEKHNSETGINL